MKLRDSISGEDMMESLAKYLVYATNFYSKH